MKHHISLRKIFPQTVLCNHQVTLFFVISSNENHVLTSLTRRTFRLELWVANSNEGASVGNDRRMSTQLAALNLRDIIFLCIIDFKPRENFVVSTRPSH